LFKRATIRNLDGELEVLKIENKSLYRENAQLRLIVETYIDGRDYDSEMWNSLKGIMYDKEKSLTKMDKSSRDICVLKRNELLDINAEMDEAFNYLTTEEFRHQTFVAELDKHLKRCESLLAFSYQAHATSMSTDKSLVDVGVQVDERDKFGLVYDLATSTVDETVEPPPKVKSVDSKGVMVPMKLRVLLKNYPRVMRIPSLEWTNQTILAIYLDKTMKDSNEDKGSRYNLYRKKELGPFVFDFFLNLCSIQSLAHMQVMQLLRACEQYQANDSKRVFLFSQQLGLQEPNQEPELGLHNTDFILTTLTKLMELQELQLNRHAVGHYESALSTKTSLTIKSHIRRSSAIKVAHYLFEKITSDGGQDVTVRVNTLENSSHGLHFIELDDFMAIVMIQWSIVRDQWEDHLKYLFRHHCSLYKVQNELQFSNDINMTDRDIVISQVVRENIVEFIRRPARVFPYMPVQEPKISASDPKMTAPPVRDDETVNSSKQQNTIVSGSGVTQGGAAISKDMVCELISKKGLIEIMRKLNTSVASQEVNVSFVLT